MGEHLEIEATECALAMPSCTIPPHSGASGQHAAQNSVRNVIILCLPRQSSTGGIGAHNARPQCLCLCSVIKIILQFCKENGMHRSFDAIQVLPHFLLRVGVCLSDGRVSVNRRIFCTHRASSIAGRLPSVPEHCRQRRAVPSRH